LKIFENLLLTLFGENLCRGRAINVGTTATGSLKLFNNHIQPNDSALFIVFNSGFGLKVKLVNFITFDLLLDCLL